MYEVVSCGDTITMKEGDTIIQYEFTHTQLKEWFRLSHAQTCASCQGTEFDESLYLHETAHPMFTARHLFVGLSKAKSTDLLSIN